MPAGVAGLRILLAPVAQLLGHVGHCPLRTASSVRRWRSSTWRCSPSLMLQIPDSAASRPGFAPCLPPLARAPLSHASRQAAPQPCGAATRSSVEHSDATGRERTPAGTMLSLMLATRVLAVQRRAKRLLALLWRWMAATTGRASGGRPTGDRGRGAAGAVARATGVIPRMRCLRTALRASRRAWQLLPRAAKPTGSNPGC